MSQNVTSSSIYLFLQQQDDWRTTADENNDNEITRGEMRHYLENSDFECEFGVSIDQVSAKVFNEFWAKVDSKASNNRMDETELNRLTLQLDAVKVATEYVEKKIDASGMDSNDKKNFKNYLLGSLTDTAVNFVQGADFNNVTQLDDAQKFQLRSKLAAAYPAAAKGAYIEYYTDKFTAQFMKINDVGLLKWGGNYMLTEDESLKKLINKWFAKHSEIDGSNPQKIADSINNFIKSYLASAGLGDSTDTSMLDEVKDSSTGLNDIQKAKLRREASQTLRKSLKELDLGLEIKGADKNNGQSNIIGINGGGYDSIYMAAVDKFMDYYCSTGYRNAQRNNGESVFEAALKEITSKEKAVELFKNSQFGKDFITTVQFADNYHFPWEGKNFFSAMANAGIPGIDSKYNLIPGSELDKLKHELAEDCGESSYPEYFKAYNKILNSLLNPNDKTYRLSNGEINYEKINKELISILKNELGISETTSTSATSSTASTSGNTSASGDSSAPSTSFNIDSVSYPTTTWKEVVNSNIDDGEWRNTIKNAIDGDTSKIKNIITDMYRVLSAVPGINTVALDTAYADMNHVYTEMMRELYTNCASNYNDRGYNKKGKYLTQSITYKGVNYTSNSDQDDDCKDNEISGSTANGNSGLYLRVRSHDDDHYWLWVDTGKIWQNFKNFYKKAL